MQSKTQSVKFAGIWSKDPGAFPHITNEKRYAWSENEDWIEGFHTGLTWLSYEYSQDAFSKYKLSKEIADFKRRLEEKVCLEHHDIGFLYGLSALAGWIVKKDDSARELALQRPIIAWQMA